MQLSILIATNRSGLLACSRLAQACSWAGPNIEVLIRDNSGDPAKRALLPQFQRENCTIIIAEPGNSLTNITEILKLAKGEFAFILADDDFCFDRAIAALPDLIMQVSADPSVVGITGAYAVELSQGSAVVEYKNIESEDPAARVAGFLNYSGPNILHYAPIRREIVQQIFDYQKLQPFLFSFHDQTISLLYLLKGRFARLKRFLYLYEVGPWEETETAQQRDVAFYKGAGFDPAINKLHWFICAFEGATMIRNSDIIPSYPMAQRQPIADLWFSAMFMRFMKQERLTFESNLAAEAENVCAKLRGSAGQMSFDDMLNDICAFMAVSSGNKAVPYFEFWNAVINNSQPAARPLVAAGGR